LTSIQRASSPYPASEFAVLVEGSDVVPRVVVRHRLGLSALVALEGEDRRDPGGVDFTDGVVVSGVGVRTSLFS
jgi:hypothetical protein